MRALQDDCRTTVPDDAQLFFVPLFTDYSLPSRRRLCEKECTDAVTHALSHKRNASEVDSVAGRHCSRDTLIKRLNAVLPQHEMANHSSSSFLDRNGGRDHLFISPRHGYSMDACPCRYEFNFYSYPAIAALRFAIEEPTRHPVPRSKYMPGFRSLPPLSMVHAYAQDSWDSVPWRQRHQRLLAVAGAFGLIHPTIYNGMNELRLALNASCAAAIGRCTLLHRPSDDKGAVVSLYWRSIFCLQPYGDGCVRNAVLDALLLGCVPVFFHRCQRAQWPWHWGSWIANASILFDADKVARGRLDPVHELLKVPSEDIHRMQRTIAEHAHCVHYRLQLPETRAVKRMQKTNVNQQASAARSFADTLLASPDAFDIALAGSGRVAADYPLDEPPLCTPVPQR